MFLASNANLEKIVQENTLARYVGEQLFPGMLFRAAATREPWEAAAGQTMTFTNPGLMTPNTTPRSPGAPRPFLTQDYEHYSATMQRYGDPVTIDMPSSAITITPTFWEKQKALALQAAQTMNRLPRDRLYKNYLAGHAIIDAVAGVTLTVSSLNGFRQSIDPTTGFPVQVSTAAPRQFLLNGVLSGSLIVGATPADANFPDGPGTLTLDVGVGAPGDRIDATDASLVIRPGGATTVDGIGAGNVLTLDLIKQAVTSLRRDNVGPCSDGYYHVHFDPLGELDLSRDNSYQRQIETRGFDDDPYLTFSIGRTQSCTYFANNECPDFSTVNPASLFQSRPATAATAQVSADIGAEVINASGIQIMRTIVIGGGAIVEKYLDETAYMSEAGVQGKVGGFRVMNNGVEIPMDGIRWILKAPSDHWNEQLVAAWSFSGDWPVPTNRLTGRSAAAYKRARVIETALNA